VVVENSREDSFRVNAGYELNGAAINGSGKTIPSQFKLDAAKDNFIGINDAWRLSYAGWIRTRSEARSRCRFAASPSRSMQATPNP
jgi:hypothetical protein